MSHLRLLHGMVETPLTPRERFWRESSMAWQERAENWRSCASIHIELRRKDVLAANRWRWLFLTTLVLMAAQAWMFWRWL